MMYRIFFSLLVFVGFLALIGYGALWLVDHGGEVATFKERLFKQNAKPSLSELTALAQQETAINQSTAKTTTAPADTSKTSDAKNASESTNSVADIKSAVTVLNGSGVAGAAGKAVDALKKDGFVNATANNATGSSYTKIVVYYDASHKATAESVAVALKKQYTGVETQVASTSEQKQTPVVVIIGKTN